jgi:SAM-dependent methyltransferase
VNELKEGCIMPNSASFRDYWSMRTGSDHTRRPGLDVFRIAAGEVRAFMVPASYRAFLDLGSGAGEVFAHLGIAPEAYSGVDYSPTMIETFKRRWPDVNVELGDATTYRSDHRFEFILVNSVLQHCSPDEVKRCFENTAAMLSPTGRILMGNVPDRSQHSRYRAGMFLRRTERHSTRIVRRVRYLADAVRHGRVDSIGYWYHPEKFVDLAAGVGLECSIFGCLLYPYRFSALLTHPGAPAEVLATARRAEASAP